MPAMSARVTAMGRGLVWKLGLVMEAAATSPWQASPKLPSRRSTSRGSPPATLHRKRKARLCCRQTTSRPGLPQDGSGKAYRRDQPRYNPKRLILPLPLFLLLPPLRDEWTRCHGRCIRSLCHSSGVQQVLACVCIGVNRQTSVNRQKP